MKYFSIKELIELAEKNHTSVAEILIRTEMEETEKSREEIENKMMLNLQVMQNSIEEGRKEGIKSWSGLSGGEAFQIERQTGLLSDGLYNDVIANALAVAGVNACMGKIVAGPTAGSGGIVPAVLLTLSDRMKLTDQEICYGLFTSSGLGYVVARNATLAGAAGGCQAECGVASAMAAGGAVELMGGSPRMVGNAFALALKNLLGLTCDPVAGLVEVPCVKRNAFAATHALTAATMALSGIESLIPPDEVIEAMIETGNLMPECLKETAEAGLATTPTGQEIRNKIKIF